LLSTIALLSPHDMRRLISFTVFCLFVGHAINEMYEVWQQIYTGCQNGTKFGMLIDRALLYINSKIGELWHKGPLGLQNLRVGKMVL